jgi:hypothetical protein
MATKPVGSSSTSPTDNKKRKVVKVAVKPKITSETIVTKPVNRARLKVGVGEKINLTFNLGAATWTTSAGVLSVASGTTTRLTVPDRAASVKVTAVDATGAKAEITFNVIEPSGVLMERAAGTGIWHQINIPSVGIRTSIYIQPADVSFENIEIVEDDCPGIVTGYFVGTTLDGISHGSHGAGTKVGVGPVVAGKGSKVLGQDTAQSGYCNFGLPYSNGTFLWAIPWEFSVGTGSNKLFATVNQNFLIDTAGAMDVSKAGATGHAALADRTSNY